MPKLGGKGPNLALRHERERRGWSQADVAEKIGVDVVSISRWERGTNAPTSSYTIKKVCDLFGLTREELGFFSNTLDEPSISPPAQEPPFEPRNPYKGLRAFRSEDARDFFGREQLIDELVEKLEKIFAQKEQGCEVTRLLAVLGPSGSGKSSVVMAGLLPRLQAGDLPESEHWVYLKPMTPGAHPLEALALTLWECLTERKFTSIHEDLRDGPASTLHLLATSLGKQPETKVVLVVDQFEELFTLTTDERERQQFIDLLLTASTERDGPVLAMLTLRADFYDRPMSYVTLGTILEAQSKSVFPMNERELEASIEQPAGLADVQLTFEEKLVEDLLFEVWGQGGALPLLQFTLQQLFQKRNGHLLTRAAYREMGGVKGALTRQAETTYTALPSDEHRRLARALFLRLIDPGVTEQDTTRRRAALRELSLPDSHQTTLLQETAAAFIAARLLTTNEIVGITTLEVSHEALIREWPRLAGWLREARDDIRLQQAISKDAAGWEQRNKPGDRLYRGSQLKEARAWARRNTPSEQETVFLRAGTAQRTRYVVSVMVIVLLLLSTTGLAGWGGWSLTRNPNYVNTTNDDGPGSLRHAITVANPGSPIRFDTNLRGQTIMLASGDLIIARNLTILGLGAGILSISSGKSGHVVRVVENVSATISGLTFKDSITYGGFIDNIGTLTLSNSTIAGNRARGPSVTGGGIRNHYTLTLINSTVSGNTSHDAGGIYNDGTLHLINSTVSGNTTTGSGGGIHNLGTLTLTNSTVSGNKASSGGGIAISEGPNNYTDQPTSAMLLYCTVYGNIAGVGGGIWIDNLKQQRLVTMGASIVAGNNAHTDPDIAGSLTTSGYNLVGDRSAAMFLRSPKMQSTDKVGVSFTDLKIDPKLQDNGGSAQPHTWTHALLPGSPAIDLIPSDVCMSFKVINDQRGVKRPWGKGCDNGAYEYSP